KEYQLVLSQIGFEILSQKVKLDNNIFLEFTLKLDVFNELDQVVIRATRSIDKSPFVYSNIQKSDIEKNNMGQDIPYILKLTPSLVASSDAGNGIGYTNLSIRGVDKTRINVTLNGVPLNDPESHSVWWVNIPDFSSSVNNIQIQRGVGTSTNGAGAFGATINLKTNKLNLEPYAKVSNSFGSFNTLVNSVSFGSGKIKEHFSFDGRLSKVHSDGYIDRASVDMKSFFFSASFFNKKTLLKATVFSGEENTYQAWSGVPKDSLETNRTYNPYTYKNEIDHYVQSHYQLHFIRKISNSFNFNASVFYITGRGYYEQYKSEESFSDYGLNDFIVANDTIKETDLIRRKWLDNGFYGINYNLLYKKNNIDLIFGGGWNKYIGYHFGNIIWMQYAGNTAIDHEFYNNLGTKTDFNTFLKADYSIADKLFVYADLQYRIISYNIKGIDDDLSDITQEYSFPFFNPKFGVLFMISKSQKLFASVAHANREPKRSDFIDAPEDKIPTPEKLYDFEFGYKLSKQNMLFEANMFYMNYKDQLILTGQINDVGAPIVTNTPESYRRGIELVFGTEILHFINWNANIALSQNKIVDFVEYVDNWDYWADTENNSLQIENEIGLTHISFSPSIVASNLLSFRVTDFLDIDFISKYVGRQYIDNSSNIDRSLNPYFVNDLSIRTSFKTKYIEKINLSFRINNIINEKYETNAWIYSYYYDDKRNMMNGYFPQATRNYLINLSLYF
ncbi:MAG: TonB-dependent receptor, partial [Bacteroidota bacterium]|nr:TonB-dependent receptor [Bacteroidota bacterium]